MTRTPRKCVIHLPDWQSGNPYQGLLANGIRASDWEVRFEDFPKSKFPLRSVIAAQPDSQTLHIHWIAPYIEPLFWSSKTYRFYAKAALLALDVILVRLSGRRVVWTVHNQLSHETLGASREIVLRRILARTVNHLIFHSKSACSTFSALIGTDLSHKSSIIPHGNYIDYYRPNPALSASLSAEMNIGPDEIVILFFGALRNYKGIPSLIDAFRRTTAPNLRLVIAGKPFDADLRERVERAAVADTRIKLHLGHVSDEMVAPLFDISHVMALPLERTLTSGSALLAMSLGKALILPENARVLDIADERGAIYYADEATLTATLMSLDVESLTRMGAHNLRSAEALDWATIGSALTKRYQTG